MDNIATKEQIEQQGYGKTGDIGGQPKTTYWTPDGRMKRAQPSMREYIIHPKNPRDIPVTGIRDANLDNGWLLAKPEKLQLYCEFCDKWHPTQEEVDKCGETKKRFTAKWNKKAVKEIGQTENGRIDKLESDVGEIKGMLKQLLERK